MRSQEFWKGWGAAAHVSAESAKPSSQSVYRKKVFCRYKGGGGGAACAPSLNPSLKVLYQFVFGLITCLACLCSQLCPVSFLILTTTTKLNFTFLIAKKSDSCMMHS